MIDEEQPPIWRQAIKDSTHALHQATWLLFSPNMNAKGAAKMLAAQREQVIPYLFQILDTPELYLESAFGGGMAPVHAVKLLGEWQVKEGVPRLLHILREDDWESSVHDASILALEQMDASIINDLLHLATENPKQVVTIASIVGKLGKGDPKIFEWLCGIFQKQKDEIDVMFTAEILLSNHMDAAVEFLEDQMKRNKYSKWTLKQIQGYIKVAREGKWIS